MTFLFHLSLLQKKKKREKKGTERSEGCVFGEKSALGEHHLWLIYSCVVSVWHRPRGDSCDEKKKKKENTKQKRERGSSNKRESPPLPSYFPTCQQVHTKTPPLSNIDLYRYMRTLVRKTSLQSALLLILFPHKNKSITWELLCMFAA